jgi:hypothetical protein
MATPRKKLTKLQLVGLPVLMFGTLVLVGVVMAAIHRPPMTADERRAACLISFDRNPVPGHTDYQWCADPATWPAP